MATQEEGEAQRLTLAVDSHMVAFIEYYVFDQVAIVTHTEVDVQHEGRGLGAEIARQALERFECKKWKVVPVCGFFAEQIRRRPQYLPLVTPYCRRIFAL